MPLPLEGIRIVANAYTWAGPYAMMMLADMGAEVIRVESTQRWQFNTRGMMARPPDSILETMGSFGAAYPDRVSGARPWNRHAMFNSHARNKKSFTVDVTKPRGAELFKRLVAQSDVVMENGTTGMMDKFGIGYEDLRKVRPDLVMISASGTGAVGPYAGHRCFGGQMEDLAGFTWLRGYPGGDWAEIPMTNHSDAAGGAGIAMAVLMALHHRDRTGRGQWVDMAQTENLVCQLGEAVMDYTMNGRSRQTIGVRHPWMAPHGVYACGPPDTWVTIAVETDEQWDALVGAMGSPEWTRDPLFATSLGRWKNQDPLDEHIGAWTKRHVAVEVMTMLQSVGVPAGQVKEDSELYGDVHLWSRGFFQMVTQAETGSHWHPVRMWQFSETPQVVRTPPVRMGEHNEYVYKEILGVTDREYGELEAEGHIGMDFVPEVM